MWESEALSINQHQSYGGSKSNYNISTFKALNKVFILTCSVKILTLP